MKPRAILHVDMDAFYASVEQRDDPRLRGQPVIVGGHPRRGVVLAASYEVRRFGVRSAMPMARAISLAPHAIVVPPRAQAYAAASEQIHAIFETFTPLVEPLSLDEAFLDVTDSVSLRGSPGEMAHEIRARIARDVCLPASAGISAVRFVAKIASDLAKPDGQREVAADETLAFLASLPIGRLWGVGRNTEERLVALGVRTVGDLALRGHDWASRTLGSAGEHLWQLSQGIDERPVLPDREAQSIGAEDTFEFDVADLEALRVWVHAQAERVARRLRRAGRQGRVVVLKLKRADFRVSTRRATLLAPTDDAIEIYRAAAALLEKNAGGEPFRLTGVSVHDLAIAGKGQLGLFDGPRNRAIALNSVLDRIAERFGFDAVVPADVAERVTGPRRDRDE